MSCHNEDEQTNGFAGGPIHLPILRNHLIPVRVFQSGFTTSTALQNAHSLIGQDGAQAAFGSQQGNLAHVSFSDAALSVHRAQSNLPHPIVKPPRPTRNHGPSSRDLPDPEHAYEAKYPKGSINPAAKIPGGFGFYLAGDNAFKKRCGDGVKEVIMSYRMMLEQGWMWAKGGKLPGMFGGEGDKAYGCSGGRKDSRCTCFDVRLMWRANGEGELYTYLPPVPSNDKVLCAIPPRSIRNNDYGYSVGRGSFNLNDAVGRWMGVALRMRMNTPGKHDGQMELWIDGKSVIRADGLVIRGDGGQGDHKVKGDGARFKGMHFQTFFGGHTEDWASPRTQRAWFADVTGVVVE